VGSDAAPVDLAGDSATGFRSSQAQATLQAIAGAPRPVGSAGHDAARDWLVARMTTLGLSVSTQKGTGVRQANFDKRRKGAISVSPYENIIGVLPGRDPSANAVLVMAHYDSVPYANGASDDAAGVAAVLETARVMAAGARSGKRPLRDTIFLLTDAEEVGLIGAQEFFDAHPLARRTGFVVNAEARGSKGRAFMFQTSPGNRSLIDLWASNGSSPTGNSLAGDVYKRLPNDTDLSVSLAKGIPGINAAYIDGLHDYHMPTDSIANTDLRSVQHLGNFALTTTRALADAKLLPDAGAGDASYFDLFGMFVLRYPVWGGWVLIVLATACLMLARVGRLGVNWKRAALGTLGAAGLFAGAAGISHIITGWAYGSGTLEFRDRVNEMDPALWVFIALSAGIVLFFRMREAVWVGSAILLTALGIAAQIWLPGASWLFSWAALISAALILIAANKGVAAPVTLYSSAIIGGLWGAMLLAGVITTYMSVAPGTPAPVALIVPFATALLGPVIIAFCKEGWGRPVGIVALTGAAIGMTWFALTDRFSARYPVTADLFHYSDGMSGKSWWATTSGKAQLPAGSMASVSPKGFDSIKWRAVPAPAIAPQKPVMSQSSDGTMREIRLASAAAPRAMYFSIIPSAPLAKASLNGKAVELSAGKPTRISWRAETPDAELILRFADTPDGQIGIDYLYALPGMPAGAPPAKGVPTDWVLFDATRVFSGSKAIAW
jgi:Peptidase family M28